MNKTLIASAIGMTLMSAATAKAALVTGILGNGTWSTDSANFTMLTSAGNTMGPDGGANDVTMMWDGNGYTSGSDYTGPGGPANVTASTSDPFFGYTWAAHDIQVFMPGSYSFDVTLQTLAHPNGANGETGFLNVVVNPGQLGMHMLFDWSGDNNIDVFVVASQNSVFGAGIGRSVAGVTAITVSSSVNNCDAGIVKNCLFDGKPTGSAGKPLGSHVWMLASVDGDGDGVMGIPMAPAGPLAGFNANFNANLMFTPTSVPVPAAGWLFGSGLLGLWGMARRRKPA